MSAGDARPAEGAAAAVPGRLAGWEWLAVAVVSLLPGVLLLPPGANFYYDWHNHQWMIGYYGEFLREHHRAPEVLQAAGAVGMPQPVFYGFLLYPLLGGVSALVGASLAIRAGVAVALLVQGLAVYLAARRAAGHRGVALVTAAAVSWSVHGMSNLYNRAALTEFFAVAFLHAAVACGVLAVTGGPGERGRQAAGWLAVLLAVLTVGAHPPTALVAVGLLLPLAAVGWRELGGAGREAAHRRKWLFVAAGLGVLALAPWVYANVRWQGELSIAGKYRDFSFSPGRVDAVWARFSPLPPDVFRTASGAPGETPYVEAPVHVILLLLAGGCVVVSWRDRNRREACAGPARRFWRALAWIGAAWFGLMVALSLSPGLAGWFRWLAPYVQFATRFVGHANVGLLLLALGVAGLAGGGGGWARWPRATASAVAVLLLLAGVAVGLKLRHGAAVREHGGEPQYAFRGARAALVTEGKADAAGDYAVLRGLPQLAPAVVAAAARVALPVGTAGAEFGQVGEARVRLAAADWVITNVVVFPWNRVTVDGAEVPRADRAAQQHRLALRLPAGEQRIAWSWEPDTAWRALRVAGKASLLLLLLGAVVWLARAAFDRTVLPAPPGGTGSAR